MTREAGAPSDSTDSTDTPAIGLPAFAATELATPSPVTLRKSTVMVSGSGRVGDVSHRIGRLNHERRTFTVHARA